MGSAELRAKGPEEGLNLRAASDKRKDRLTEKIPMKEEMTIICPSGVAVQFKSVLKSIHQTSRA